MAKKKKAKQNKPRNKPSAPRRNTPQKKNKARAAPRKKPNKAKKRKRNAIRPIGMVQTGLFALIGLVLTRQVPQFALGTRNSGIIGYFSNFVAALISSYAATKFVNKKTGQAMLIGGMLYLVNRVITEQFAPVGKILSLAGLGDAQAAGLGRVREGYFPLPVVVTRDGRPVIPRAILRATSAEIARTAPRSTAGANMKGLRKGMPRAA